MERQEVLQVLGEKALEVLGTADLAQADSLAVVELVMDAEDLFSVELPEQEVAAASSLEDLADVVLRHLGGSPV
jgi:acyl carrier protein